MGYQLRIYPVEPWLAELREAQPEAARQVDEALDALRADGAAVGPPLVAPVDYVPDGRDVGFELDRSYQRQLEAVNRVRRQSAEVATLRKRLEVLLDEAMDDDQRARLRAARDGLQAQEEKIFQISRRMQQRVEAFHSSKEVLRASFLEALSDEATLLGYASLVSADVPAERPADLMELRPGAPDRIVARLLFTVEDPETAIVIAAATEDEILHAWYDEVVLSADMGYGTPAAEIPNPDRLCETATGELPSLAGAHSAHIGQGCSADRRLLVTRVLAGSRTEDNVRNAAFTLRHDHVIAVSGVIAAETAITSPARSA
jgi:hypothetical protein